MNLVDRVLEVHTGPTKRRYKRIAKVPIEGSVSPHAFPELIVRVADVIRG